MNSKTIALLCLTTLCFTCTNLFADIQFPPGFDTALAGSETTSVSGTDGDFFIDDNFDNGATVIITTPGFGSFFIADLAAPQNAALTVGLFEDARRFPFQDFNEPGFDFSTDGRGSSQLSADFEILEIAFDAAGAPIVLDAVFEQHSEFSDPGLFGRIRVNASPVTAVPEPSGLIIGLSCFGLVPLRRRRK